MESKRWFVLVISALLFAGGWLVGTYTGRPADAGADSTLEALMGNIMAGETDLLSFGAGQFWLTVDEERVYLPNIGSPHQHWMSPP